MAETNLDKTEEVIEFDFSEEPVEQLAEEIGHEENLVPYFITPEDIEELAAIGADVAEMFEADLESRSSWENSVVRYLDNLGLNLREADPETQMFEGACNADHPLVIESVVKYQSKASAELFPAAGPVKTKIVGEKTHEIEERANRVKNYLNHQITQEMPEFYPDGERVLFAQSLIGSAFKRPYYIRKENRVASDCIFPDQLVVNSNAKDLERAERISYFFPISTDTLDQYFAEGFFYSEDEASFEAYDIAPSPFQEKINELLGIGRSEYDEGFEIIEQHINLVLPEPFGDPEELARPYIVYVEKSSQKVLGIFRNWEEGDVNFKRKRHFIHYPFIVGFGFYGLGYAHLLGNIQVTLTAILRALVDSGQFANMQGGFKLKGFRVVDNQPIAPGEFRDVEYAGQSLKDAILPLQFKEPSSTLYNMLQFLEARGQKFADSTEQVIAESTNYGPVGTTMALLEASTRFFNSIHKRNHYALGQELKLIEKIHREQILPQDPTLGEPFGVTVEDLGPPLDIIPVSDPNISSNAHRLTLAQTRLDVAQRFPQHYDMREILFDFHSALGDTDIERFLPSMESDPPQPLDPLSDIMRASQGKPIVAFSEQDHMAHIQVKSAWLNDPMGGLNELNRSYSPAVAANVREHLVLQWQADVQGMTQNMAEGQEISDQLLGLAAERTAKFHAQEAEGQNEDPLKMSAWADLQKVELDRDKFEHQKGKDLIQLAFQNRELNLEALEAQARNNIEEAKLAESILTQNKDLGVKLIIQALTKAKQNSNKS